MDAKTLTALKGSIKHWEENANNDVFDHDACSSTSCPLCLMYNPHLLNHGIANYMAIDIGCTDCPVKQETGANFCRGTPYYNAVAAHETWGEEDHDEAREAFKAAAQLEVNFLTSLLPDEG